MKTRDIKTIYVRAKEWFDKINGNSYFSAVVVINGGRKNEVVIEIPLQYGYGDHYRHVCFRAIRERLNCFKSVDKKEIYWRAYEKYKIKYSHNKQENCLKRELIKG
jgi:hypothetical protein